MEKMIVIVFDWRANDPVLSAALQAGSGISGKPDPASS